MQPQWICQLIISCGKKKHIWLNTPLERHSGSVRSTRHTERAAIILRLSPISLHLQANCNDCALKWVTERMRHTHTHKKECVLQLYLKGKCENVGTPHGKKARYKCYFSGCRHSQDFSKWSHISDLSGAKSHSRWFTKGLTRLQCKLKSLLANEINSVSSQEPFYLQRHWKRQRERHMRKSQALY